MIFVNTLSGVSGMPPWMGHVAAGVDGMTFPDVVFPAFLFIVGMSIPFAMEQRQAAGDTGWKLWRHVLARAAGLLVFGVFMVNAEEGYNEAAMGITIHVWSLLFYACAILVWAVYRFENKRLVVGMRLAGVAGLIALAIVFRGGAGGDERLTPQWWGILGLIGWAYLYATIAWRVTRARTLPIALTLLACVAYYCVFDTNACAVDGSTMADYAALIRPTCFRDYAHVPAQSSALWRLLGAQSGNAVHTAIALCGVLTTLIFFSDGRPRGKPFGKALVFAGILAALAFALRPWFTISKIAATPSWALYSAAICVLLFAAMYWLVDLKQRRGWVAFFRPAAANPLLTYIIPFIIFALMETLNLAFPSALGAGMPGLIWAVAYALIVMALASALNRMHIKLQL